MTLAVSSWSWHAPYYAGRWSLLDLPAAAAALGLLQIEANDFMLPPPRYSRVRRPLLRLLPGAPVPLWRYSNRNLAQLRVAADRNRVTCRAWTLNSDFSVPRHLWPAQRLYLTRGLAAAASLGACLLRVNLGGQPETDRARDPLIAARLAAFVRRVRRREPRIAVTVENHWGVSTDLARHLAIVDAARAQLPASFRHALGCCFDPGNVPGGDDRERWWAALAERANHYHFKTTAFTPTGDDPYLPHLYLFSLLDGAAYQGAVTIEYQGKGDPALGVRRSVSLFRRLRHI